MELIASTGGASKAKKKEKASLSSFWDDVGIAVLKAQETISVDDLSPLGARSLHELMSSHVHKVMQVQIVSESLFVVVVVVVVVVVFCFLVLPSFLRRCWANPYISQGSTWILKGSWPRLNPRLRLFPLRTSH